ncbi:hypothetical protein CF392_08985 [Tamilnaduibacter salinus]|uniref:Pre-peptidase n=2 Tax=Tamilnaduibacter salinus TaxID=1484056 RepID=A0A2A2I391_9GAMM|nr:hypothetical protein CF392_08985 [Tamilnaduibacter salinus]
MMSTAVVALAGCADSGSDGGVGADPGDSQTASVQGASQKGPFQQGANVTARNLQADGAIGSESAATTTSDGRGSYSFDGLEWSGATRLRIEGTYFDEVQGSPSSESRYLDAVIAASQASEANINLFTHAQSQRVRTLMGNGLSFADARSQAEQEWQAIVGTSTPATELDILDGQSGSTESDNASLLLFSAAVLQSGLSQTDLDGLRDDFADDGQINGNAQSAYESLKTAAQDSQLLEDARDNLQTEFDTEPPNGDASDIGWIPGACEQTRLNVSNRQILCTSDDPLADLNRQSDKARTAAAVVFEKAGHYRIEISKSSGNAFGGNNWTLYNFNDQDTREQCESSAEQGSATGDSVVEGLTNRLNDDERTCLEVFYAPSPDSGGPSELRVGLVPINDGGPSLDEAVPLTLGERFTGKIGNYVGSGSDFPAYSYYRFQAPTDGTYRITVDGYSNLGSGSMRIALFEDQDNNGSITFFNDQERFDFTGGPGTDSTSTTLERSLSAGTYVVRVFNGTGYRATFEGDANYLTNLELSILVEQP